MDSATAGCWFLFFFMKIFLFLIGFVLFLSSHHPGEESLLLLLGEGAEVFVVLAPGPAVVDDLTDGAPVGEAADGAVVDEEVGVELAGADAGLVDFLAGVVAVDGEELQAALFAEVDGFLQEPAFTGGPEDEGVSFRLYLLEGCYGEGEFLADVRVTMLDDGAVEVYCNDHSVVSGSLSTSTRSHLRVQVATTMTPAMSTTTRLSRAPLTLMNVPSRPLNWPPWMRTRVPLVRLISSGLKKRMPSAAADVTLMKFSIWLSGTTTICFFPSSVGM